MRVLGVVEPVVLLKTAEDVVLLEAVEDVVLGVKLSIVLGVVLRRVLGSVFAGWNSELVVTQRCEKVKSCSQCLW